jgi:hypothetical protein
MKMVIGTIYYHIHKSHSNHVPTGTFFDREDVLVNPNYIEVFDKYYKYTALTNESGDFMIFGVPDW